MYYWVLVYQTLMIISFSARDLNISVDPDPNNQEMLVVNTGYQTDSYPLPYFPSWCWWLFN